jgi:hypothetical protein
MTYPTHTIYVIYYYVKKTLKPLNPKTQELYDNTCMTWKKNWLHFSICACHPCAGAMLIFSVSFQF